MTVSALPVPLPIEDDDDDRLLHADAAPTRLSALIRAHRQAIRSLPAAQVTFAPLAEAVTTLDRCVRSYDKSCSARCTTFLALGCVEAATAAALAMLDDVRRGTMLARCQAVAPRHDAAAAASSAQRIAAALAAGREILA